MGKFFWVFCSHPVKHGKQCLSSSLGGKATDDERDIAIFREFGRPTEDELRSEENSNIPISYNWRPERRGGRLKARVGTEVRLLEAKPHGAVR